MLFDPFFGFRLEKKPAEKVVSVRPYHFDAPISFLRDRFQRYGIHESPPVTAIVRRSAEVLNESAGALQTECKNLCKRTVKPRAKCTMFFDSERETSHPALVKSAEH
jgi:hypothetical protein